MLFEEWLNSGEDWRSTETYLRVKNSSGEIDSSQRDWVTRQELEQKIGKEAADRLIDYLERNRPEQCRDHPDAPGIKHSARECVCVCVTCQIYASSTCNCM